MPQVPTTAPPPPASTRRGRSRVATQTQTSWVTASCGPATAPLPRSIPRVPHSPSPTASIRRGRSRENTGSRSLSIPRSRDGTFTSIDPPGSNFTGANSINPAGAIVRVYNFGSHGFLSAASASSPCSILRAPYSPGTFPISAGGGDRGIVYRRGLPGARLHSEPLTYRALGGT